MSNNINISPTISPDILKKVSSSSAIKTFGDQLINGEKEKIISASLGKREEIEKQIQEIISTKIQVGKDHNSELKRLETIFKRKQITEEQYKAAVAAEDVAYLEKINDLNAQQAKFKEDLDKIISDPYKKLKSGFQERKSKLKKLKVKFKKDQATAKIDLALKVTINTAKSLAPVIALQLAKQLFIIINQRKKLEILVDQVNNYIDTQVKDEQTVTIAINLRNNAIRLIDNSVAKLENFKKALDRITKTLAIITAVLAAINIIINLPIPLPPILLTKSILQPKLQKLLALVAAITTILAIATTILKKEIDKIKELKERLKQISLKLDGKSIDNINSQQLSDLSNLFLPTGGDFEMYKGFKFKIKTEENKAFEVKGNKRRYAVAIDRDGVEVLKSEFSFTLDPNDLVNQLKLVIDQQNLQG